MRTWPADLDVMQHSPKRTGSFGATLYDIQKTAARETMDDAEACWMMPKCAVMDLLILFRVVIYLFILYINTHKYGIIVEQPSLSCCREMFLIHVLLRY